MAPSQSNRIKLKDWTNQARDLEPGMRPLPRSVSWYRRNWTAYGFGATNIRRFVPTRSSNWAFRWFSKSNNPGDSVIEEKSQLLDAQHRFIVAILGAEPRPELLPACLWYIGFLEHKIGEAWSTLFSPVLAVIDPSADYPRNQNLSIAFSILELIVLELERENLALTDVVDKLYNNKIFKDTDHERSHASQLLLALVGWISSLYPARSNPEPKKLQIIDPRVGTSALERPQAVRRMRWSKVKTIINYEQTLESNDQPLHMLLGKFGPIVPQRQRELGTGYPTSPMVSVRPGDEWIEVSLLCFHTLNKFASIKIEWVDSLSLHLEFDSYTKVVKVFRLPSLCLLMCCCEKISPLSQLFSDSMESNNLLSIEVEDACEFYREVLLTYRLIFGQDKGSYKTFNVVTGMSKYLPREYHDSLISTLCGESWESKNARQVYDLIEAEDPSRHYDPSIDFPFFGKRLLDIQRYVRGHDPSNFWAFWYDKRNPSQWWTFWVATVIASITLILTLTLGILQTVLGILQVLYTKEQLH